MLFKILLFVYQLTILNYFILYQKEFLRSIIYSYLVKTLADLEVRLKRANFIDTQGDAVLWLGDGMSWKNKIYDQFLTRLHDHGFQQLQLPRIVPTSILDQVAERFMDFRNGVFRLAEHDGDDWKTREQYLNSTSDPVLNHYLKSRPDLLPLKAYVREQLFRPQSRAQRPLLITEEYGDIIEAYDINTTTKACNEAMERAASMLKEFIDETGLAAVAVDQPLWGNKPVATRVVSLQTYHPFLKRAMRNGSAYQHNTTFSDIFGVADKHGVRAHQVGFGFGERLLPTILSHHGDQHGLAIMPSVAPVQAAIIPYREEDIPRARRVAEALGLRSRVDDHFNSSLQQRLYRHLQSGVPLRVSIHGEGDIEYSRRDTFGRAKVNEERLEGTLNDVLLGITHSYRERSLTKLHENIAEAGSLLELTKVLNERKLALIPFCGTKSCGTTLEASYVGEVLGALIGPGKTEDCIGCGVPGVATLYGRRAPNP
jgi:prolyl-tRNA synthetase